MIRFWDEFCLIWYEADFVIVVVSALVGAFEAGISRNGQTIQHLKFAQNFGNSIDCFFFTIFFIFRYQVVIYKFI